MTQRLRASAPLDVLCCDELEFDRSRDGRVDRSGARPDSAQRWSNSLERTIASEVIPRLMLAHASEMDEPHHAASPGRGPVLEDVAEFTRIVLAHRTDVAMSFVETLLDQGVSLESVFVDLVTPSARLLGEMWKADLCSFTDVTVGLARLQQIVRAHAGAFESGGLANFGDDRRALLVAMPGEQHTLGIFLVETFLRRAGWDVHGGPPMTSDELTALARRDWFAVVGLSISADDLLGTLTAVIRTIRRESRNRSIGVIVGGRVFLDHPEWVELAGADAMALDATQAVTAAENMVGTVEGRC